MTDTILFPEPVVHALGWTLLHALWQGGLLAMLVWILRLRQAGARTRYLTAYSALVLQLLAGIATFFLVFETPEIAGSAPAARLVALWPEAPLTPEVPEALTQSVAARLQAFHPLIVSLWLTGMAFFLIRLAGGLWFLGRIKRQGRAPAAETWSNSLRALQERVAFSRPVRLLESVLVRTPMTIGFFKPVILVPVALANQLQPEEVEAILAHELAHILRRDWLMNLVQVLIESLFYYHPAIWWLSGVVRTEREHCCDDYAVSLTGNRLHYARTLVRIQEISKPAPIPVLALGLTGTGIFPRRRGLLLQRIHRLLQPQQQKLELMEKMIVSAMLMALLTLWGIRSGKTPFTGTLQAGTFGWLTPGPEAQQYGIATDTVPEPKKRMVKKIVHDDGKQRLEMEMEGDRIQKLVVDGKEIPAEDYSKYESITRDILADIPPPPPPPSAPAPHVVPRWEDAPRPPAAPDAPARWEMRAPPAPPAPPTRISREQDSEGNTLIRLEQHGEPVEIVVKDGKVLVNGKVLETGASMPLPGVPGHLFWNDTDGHVIELEEGGSFIFTEGMRHRAPELEREIRVMELDRSRMNQDQRRIELEMRRIEHDAEKQHRLAQEEGRRARELTRVEKEIIVIGEQAGYPRKLAFFHGAGSLNEALRDQLLEDGLISDPNEYKIELTGKHLKVNGKKQPAGVHRRYLERYEQYNGRPMGAQDVIRIVEDD